MSHLTMFEVMAAEAARRRDAELRSIALIRAASRSDRGGIRAGLARVVANVGHAVDGLAHRIDPVADEAWHRASRPVA